MNGATGSTSAWTVWHGWAAVLNTVLHGLRTCLTECQAYACNADSPGVRFALGNLLNCTAQVRRACSRRVEAWPQSSACIAWPKQRDFLAVWVVHMQCLTLTHLFTSGMAVCSKNGFVL